MILWRTRDRRLRWLRALPALVVLLASLVAAGQALAAEAPPHWFIESRPTPTNLPLEGEGQIVVTLANIGGAAVNGEKEKVTITDRLPEGVEATHAKGWSNGIAPRSPFNRDEYVLNGKLVTNPTGMKCTESPKLIACTFEQKLPAFEQLEIFIRVKTDLSARPEPGKEPENRVEVAGGGTAPASLSRALKITGEQTVFGVEQYELRPENEAKEKEAPGNEEGWRDTQAGSHPFQLTTAFNLNTARRQPSEGGIEGQVEPTAPALQRNLYFKLPPGLIGDPSAVPECEGLEFSAEEPGNPELNACPEDTAVGVAMVSLFNVQTLKYRPYIIPVFNLVPAPGEPARFGFAPAHIPVILNTAVQTGGDYGVTVSVQNAPETVDVLGSRVTLWGVPEEASHDEPRGWDCLGYEVANCGTEFTAPEKPLPFLTLPTSCTGIPVTTVTGESWPREEDEKTLVGKIGKGPGENEENSEYRFPSPLTGCNKTKLGFNPSISVEPETEVASTPTGLKVDVKLPQEEPEGDAEAAVKETKFKLPPGVLLNPAAASGLDACAEGEDEPNGGVDEPPGGVGFTGNSELDKEFEPGALTSTFTEKLPEHLEPGINFCANASKIGVVHIRTPDLAHELVGGVYLARQDDNPFGSLLAMYIVAQDPVSKVLVKLAGEVHVTATGQVENIFKNTPEAPFEELKLELFGGPRASLTTPAACGSYGNSEAEFTPWSGTESVKVKPEQAFQITSGPEGTPCESPQPFKPSFTAGSTNSQAGAFTPFTLTIGVPQADSALKTISNMQLPPGLAAEIASVTPCPEPQAAEGNCGPESEIGQSTALTGLGSEPNPLKGQVYLTGPYEGKPFGLSAVTKAEAGPFHLGKVVVRSSIAINPYTAAATIDTKAATFFNEDGVAGEQGKIENFSELPEFIAGIPSQIKQLNVTVDREHFEFNPTNCGKDEIEATLTGRTGSEHVEAPFQVSNCASLPFKPVLTASVKGQGSKTDGTTFAVKLESPGLGQANIQKVDLTLPEALPSRLTTIEKACLEKVFNANPASCDEGSVIGEGIVHTPVFKNPLRGPAYLVSHGAAAFPDVEFVLQGEGVTVILDGKTDIKHGITYSKFETSPDAPFTSFESIFPEGPHSAVTAYVSEAEDYNLCKKSLSMPTELTAQNGAYISQDTKIVVTGCGEVKSFKETNAQKLEKALKACRTKYKAKSRKAKRVACEKAARKKYGAKIAKKASRKTKKK